MNPMLKVSAAVLIAAMSVVPALAAVDSAAIVMGTKTDIVPVTALDKIIGKWTMADITALNGAKTVTVFETKTLYDAADVKLVGAADVKMHADLLKLRAAINGDATLKAWFATNKLDVNNVIAVSDDGGKLDLFLY